MLIPPLLLLLLLTDLSFKNNIFSIKNKKKIFRKISPRVPFIHSMRTSGIKRLYRVVRRDCEE